MKIFKVQDDTNNIQIVQPVDHSLITIEFLTFDGESRLQDWEDLMVYIYNPQKKPENFYRLTSGILVFDEKALEACRTVFEKAGEILPIQVERGPKLYILNVLECVNILDYNRTKWDYYPRTGRKGRILEHKFYENKIRNESTIFKIPEENKIDIFCYTDERDEDDQFYHLYHKHKLTGLIFEEIDNS